MPPSKKHQHRPSQRLLIILPSWIGDAVMAMPTLKALRELHPDAHITAMGRAIVRPMVDACPWIDRLLTVRSSKGSAGAPGRRGTMAMAQRLRAGNFDTCVLLPNSFRWALLARMAGIPRRVGYDRDGRGLLLTDRLLPLRADGKFVPVPTRDYYLGIARYLGAANPDPAMQLFTRPEHDEAALKMLAAGGYTPGQGRKLVLLNPGANYGDAKMWYPDRFAAVGDKCAQELGAVVGVTGSPKERGILDQVIAAAKTTILDLPKLGMDLPLLKSVVKQAALVVTNDTGPRHIAAALGVPVVTVFGPTDPKWTTIGFKAERQVMVEVFCGPCQKKKCPLDHRCMTQVDPGMVFEQVSQLLRGPTPAPAADTK